MKSIKLSIVAALLATTSVVTSVSASEVEVSANVAMTSNYVWRGMTQSGNNPAVQGGFDVAYGNFYAGVWGSAVEGYAPASSEIDIYAGYASEIDKFSYDIGYGQYTYAGATDESNFGEAYLSLGYDFDVASVSAAYYLGVDTNDVANDAANGWEPGDAWELGVSVPLPMEVTLDGTYGEYDDAGTLNAPTNNFGDYYSVSLTKTFGKFDATLAYTGMDYEAAGSTDEDSLVFTVATSF